MLIAIDIDGVLYPLHGIIRDYLIENGHIEKGTSVKDAFKFLKNNNRLFIDNIFSIPILYERRLPLDFIVEQVGIIHADGNEVIYLTSRPENLKRITYKFLEKFPAPEAVFFSNNKQRFCYENEVDVLFDDREENLTNHKNTLALCVQSFEHPDVINPRFTNLLDAYRFAKGGM